ncbi:MAG: hypothetical protein HY545_00815 [Candidatus Doudnabacteria bacterium]|nr:hypothetical protein [Candidatus Doudnabacteria bacterium]
MLYALFSIIVLTVVFWLVNKARPKTVFCPTCVATILVWLILLLGIYFNIFSADAQLVAILMAISLGAGIERFGPKYGLWWKTLMVVLGVPAVYFLAFEELLTSIYFLLAILFLTAIFNLTFTKKEPGCCD